MPSSSSVSSEVAAVEIAQPWPSKETSLTRPSSSSLMKTCCSSPQNGFVSSKSRSKSSSRPKLCGPLVVLEDLIAVELVHGQPPSDSPNTLRASWRPSTSRSISLARRVDAEARPRGRRRRRGAPSAAARSGGRRERRPRGGRGSRRRRGRGSPRARRRPGRSAPPGGGPKTGSPGTSARRSSA